MSDFDTEITKAISSKVVILQIDIGRANDFWVPYQAGVYIVNFNNEYSKLTSFTTYPDAPSISVVGSVTANGVQLARVSSPSACRDQDSSFHYESGTLTLYVHCSGGLDPDLFKMRIGQVYAFRYGGQTATYGGIIVENRLVSPPALAQSKDPQFYGSLAFDSLTFKVDNADGQYDLLTRENNVFGNKGRILIGFDGWDITSFSQRFEGVIGRIRSDAKFLTVEVKDQRASLTRAIPSNTFNQTDYPNLDDGDVGQPIPRVFGTCDNCPVYITDKEQTTGGAGSTITYHAKIGDTEYTTGISAISAIYVNDVPTTSTNEDLGTREFTLIHTTDTATNQYTPGDDVTADLIGEVTSTGGVIENGGEVIRRLLKDYYNVNYTGDFYNFALWFESRARDIGLWMGEQNPLIDWVGQICSEGIQADFFYDGDGKYCLKIFNENDPSRQTIRRANILSTPTIDDDPYEVITSTVIGYKKDWANNEFYLLIDTSNEETIFDKYPVYRQEDFETILTDTTDAGAYSDIIFQKSDDVQTLIKVNIANWVGIKRNIGDIITVYVDRPNDTVYGQCKCEIVGYEINLADGTESMNLRLISRLDFIPYTESIFYTDNEDSPDNNWYVGNDAGTDNRYYGMTIHEG